MASRRPVLPATTSGLAICAVFALSYRTAYGAPSSNQEFTEASQAIELGELARAAALLEESNQPRANFLRALIAIASGDVERAQAWIALLPEDPATDTLAEMVRLQSTRPLDLELLAAAWYAAGTPDLRSSRLLPPKIEIRGPLPRPPEHASTVERFLILLTNEQELGGGAVAYVVFSLEVIHLAHEIVQHEEQDLDVRLVAAELLRLTGGGDPRPVYERAIELEPDNLYFRLTGAALEAPPADLQDQHVQDLEALARGKRNDWHFYTIYLRARDVFAPYATPIEARTSAFDVAVFSRAMEFDYLTRMVEANASHDLEPRRCRALERIAETISGGSSLLDKTIGTRWLVQIAQRCGGLDEATRVRAEFDELWEPWHFDGPMAANRWPIPLSPEELDAKVADEASFYFSISRRAERTGRMQWFARGELLRQAFWSILAAAALSAIAAGWWSRRWLRRLSMGLALAIPLVLAIGVGALYSSTEAAQAFGAGVVLDVLIFAGFKASMAIRRWRTA